MFRWRLFTIHAVLSCSRPIPSPIMKMMFFTFFPFGSWTETVSYGSSMTYLSSSAKLFTAYLDLSLSSTWAFDTYANPRRRDIAKNIFLITEFILGFCGKDNKNNNFCNIFISLMAHIFGIWHLRSK